MKTILKCEYILGSTPFRSGIALCSFCSSLMLFVSCNKDSGEAGSTPGFKKVPTDVSAKHPNEDVAIKRTRPDQYILRDIKNVDETKIATLTTELLALLTRDPSKALAYLDSLPAGSARRQLLENLLLKCPKTAKFQLLEYILQSPYSEDLATVRRIFGRDVPYMSSSDLMVVYGKLNNQNAKEHLLIGASKSLVNEFSNLADAIKYCDSAFPLVPELKNAVLDFASLRDVREVVGLISDSVGKSSVVVDSSLASSIGQRCAYQGAEQFKDQIFRLATTQNNPSYIQGFVGGWLQTNSEAASNYVKSLGNDIIADHAKLSIVNYLVSNRDQEGAKAWNETIQSKELKAINNSRFLHN